MDRQHFNFVPFLRCWRAADKVVSICGFIIRGFCCHDDGSAPWHMWSLAWFYAPVVTQTPTAGRYRPSSQLSTELQEEKSTLKMDFRSNNFIKSDQTRFEWSQTLESENVSIIPPNSTAPREVWLHFMNKRNFPTSHDGPNWADEMENLGFDSWIISEAPDSLIDPPTDCRTTDGPNGRKRAV